MTYELIIKAWTKEGVFSWEGKHYNLRYIFATEVLPYIRKEDERVRGNQQSVGVGLQEVRA